jgi:cell wall-associated NlpC family hydrolase
VEEVASVWLGTPYRYGGTDERGLDCSALVQIVMGDLGVDVPRTTRDQQDLGRPIDPRDLRAGDLLFFRLDSSRVNHVGLALGRDRFIHASTSRGVVVDRLMSDYYTERFVEARRVFAE